MLYNILVIGGIFMPATITHAYFTKDVYDVLPDEIQNKIDINRLKIFIVM